MACTAAAAADLRLSPAGSVRFPSLQPSSDPDLNSEDLLKSSPSVSPPPPLASSSSTPAPAAAAADLPADILNCIRKRLPLDDYLRFPAVCSSWRSAAKRIARQPFSDAEFPWLFFFPLSESRKELAAAISLSPDKSLPPRTYSIPVPQRFQGHDSISSDSHCLMIENTDYESQDPDTLGIYIVNPFDSWAQLGRLPSSSTLPPEPDDFLDGGGEVSRIAMNSSVALAVWGFGLNLAYTRLGIDRVWINLEDAVNVNHYQDVVAYEDGLLCALDVEARKVFAFDFSSPAVRLIDLTLNLPAYQESTGDGWTCFQQARLVNSSSKLFLVRWRNFIKKKEKKRREVDVYKLMDDGGAEKQWVPIKCLGNVSFFLGDCHSISLSTTDFPRLRSNCIYIPYDAGYRITSEEYMLSVTDDKSFRHHLIYDLGNGSWEQYYSSKKNYRCLWMTPRLLSNGDS